MVYASFDEASSDERFDAVLNRLFVRSGEFAVSADLVESLVVDVLAGSALQAEYGLPVAESTSDELLASGHERDDGLVLRLGLVRLLLLLRFGSDFRPVLPPVSAFVSPRRRAERLLRRSSCGFTSQSATYVQLPQLSQCSLS